jgi:hypothetical protein
VSFDPDFPGLNGFVTVGPTGFLHSPNELIVLNASNGKVTPVAFHQIVYAFGGKLWALSDSALYTSNDFGTTWYHVYNVSARKMCISQCASVIYILRNDGVITRQYRNERPTINPIGTTVINQTTTFINYSNFGTVQKLIPSSTSTIIRPGVYSVSYGFSMGITSTTGECVNKNVKFGLSSAENDYEYSSKIEPYSISFTDSSTWQSFNSNAVIVITYNTFLNITTVLLNNPVSDPTDTYLSNYFINVVRIGDLV